MDDKIELKFIYVAFKIASFSGLSKIRRAAGKSQKNCLSTITSVARKQSLYAVITSGSTFTKRL